MQSRLSCYLKNQIKLLLGEGNVNALRNYCLLSIIYWSRTIRSITGLLLSKEINKKFIFKKFSNAGKQVFFGYYDLSPFSNDERLLLAMHAPLENLSPKSHSEVIIGYYELKKEKSTFIDFGETETWCWQQGCRLQWYPETSNQDVLYNKLVEDQYGCVIQNIKSKDIIKTFKRPVYSVSKDGNWGLSLNFSRLQRLRPGYGYNNLPDNTDGELAPKEDGIWRINMNTGEEVLLFSVAEIVNYEPLESMRGAEHYFNHILFNPDGSRFMFFHIWLKEGKRFIRLITSDLDGKAKYALINEGHVSHYTWKSSDYLLAYSTHENTGRNYHLYKDMSDEIKVIGKDVLNQDGHPSYSQDGSLLLTDTYVDKYGEQNLLIYNPGSNKLSSLGSFYSPFRYRGEFKCDLHPRWSPGGTYVCIDSACEGKRAMYLIQMNDMQMSHARI